MDSQYLKFAHFFRVFIVLVLLIMYTVAFAMARWVSTDTTDWGLWTKCDKGKFLISDPDKCHSVGDNPDYFEAIRALACVTLVSFVIQMGIAREGLYIDKRKWPCFFAVTSSLMAAGTAVLSKVTYEDDDRWKDDNPSVGDSWILTICVAVLSAMLGVFHWWFDEKRRQPDVDSKSRNSIVPLPVPTPPGPSEPGALKPHNRLHPSLFSQSSSSPPAKITTPNFIVSSHWQGDQESNSGTDAEARTATAAAAGGIGTRRRLAPLERSPLSGDGSSHVEDEEGLPRRSRERRRKRRRHKKRRREDDSSSDLAQIVRSELYAEDLRTARSRVREFDGGSSDASGHHQHHEVLHSYTLPPTKGEVPPTAPPPSYREATSSSYMDLPPPPAVTVLRSPFLD